MLGVLQLSNNKTYGYANSAKPRHPMCGLHKPKLLYKCIPDDPTIGPVLIPYEIKLGFSKKISNTFIVFRLLESNSNPNSKCASDPCIKSQQGTLLETIGNVNDLAAFFSYRLRCRGLSFPKPKWNPADLFAQVNEAWITTHGHEDRQQEEVYTIDPEGCTDFDDAFSITPCKNKTKVSIYIANVASWLMQMDQTPVKNEIDIFAWIQRVSTIYLPTGNMPMLPPILSETHCSLKSGNIKLVLAMDCFFNDLNENTEHENKKDLDPEIKFGLAVVRVRENLVYETARCVSCPAYQKLRDLTHKLDPSVMDSHDVIEYWMVRMNRECGKKMAEKKTGIFRVCPTGNLIESSFPVHLPEHLRSRLAAFRRNQPDNSLNSLNSSSNARYSLYSSILLHGAMNIVNYVHITSPIRRLADLLNQLLFLRDCMDIPLSEPATCFLNRWTANIDMINRQMLQTRKYQMECELMHACHAMCLDTEPREVTGCIFGIVSDANACEYEYMVYIEELKLFSKVKEVITDNGRWIENYMYDKFRVYMFEDESKLYRKIRVQRL